MSHEPECDEAWNWPDFMSGRGIEDEHCWMCGLLRRVRADERQRMAAEYLVSDREQQESDARAYSAGVQAARDAVDVALLGTLQTTRDRAIAAIDGLKGEPHV